MQKGRQPADTFGRLEKLMRRGFLSVEKKITAMAEDITGIKEDITGIKEELSQTATKEDVKKVDDRVVASENKIVGMYRLDSEKAMQARELNIPRRVHNLEEHVYGPGGSKHPKHVPLR